MGLNIVGKWTVGGALPGERHEAIELGLGIPLTGLWLREDVNMKCNILMTHFVKKTLQNAHVRLVDRLLFKAQLSQRAVHNAQLLRQDLYLPLNLPTSPNLLESTFHLPVAETHHPNGDLNSACKASAPPVPSRSDLRPTTVNTQRQAHSANWIFELEA
jgi:hypothetical protein